MAPESNPKSDASRQPVSPLSAYIAAVVSVTGESGAVIEGRRRAAHIARPRMAGMALAFRDGHSSPRVGEAFGWRDHTTVLHAHRQLIEGRLSREAAQIVAAMQGGEG